MDYSMIDRQSEKKIIKSKPREACFVGFLDIIP
jgi:hypothetical protein